MKHYKPTLTGIRGAIDPYTLGFLLSLLGASLAYSSHSNESANNDISISAHANNQAATSIQTEQTKQEIK